MNAALPKVLVQSREEIFFQAPQELVVSEAARSRYASLQHIDMLIEELQEKGPMVGVGKLGPAAYEDRPFKLKQPVGGKAVYGWEKNAKRKDAAPQTYFLVLGAKKVQDYAVVYFTLSQDSTEDRKAPVRKHILLKDDAKIYVASHKTFLAHLFDLYPPVPPKTDPADEKKSEIQEYLQRLEAIPLPKDYANGWEPFVAKCKPIGQEIFDAYKKERGNSMAGKEMAMKVCNALQDPIRSRTVEVAWDGIGDHVWRWQG